MTICFASSLLVIHILLTAKAWSYGFLDLEELQTSLYSVEIVETPVSFSEDGDLPEFSSDNAVIPVTSKVGQKFLCHYRMSENKAQEEPEADAAHIKIADLLEPMRGHCLIKHKDWWSYQFCYGEEITQFHMQDSTIVGDVISLGKYESDQTWNPEDLEKLKKSQLNRYHTQKYVNGSICDLTKKPRKAEVRFSCLESEVDQIGAVAELESCSYTVFIYTSKICHHPYLRPPVKTKPSPIECQPLISHAAYEVYLAEKEQQSAIEDKRPNEGEQSTLRKDEPQGIPTLTNDNLDEIKRVMKEAFGNALDFDDMDVEYVDTSSFTDLSDRIDKVLEHLSTPVDETLSENPTTDSSGTEQLPSDKQNEKLSDMMKYIEEQEKKLKSVLGMDVKHGADVKEIVSKYRENIKHFISAQFDDIIDEAQNDLENAGEDVSEAMKDVKNLKKLMSQVLESKLDELEGKKEPTSSGDQKKPVPSTANAQPAEGMASDKKETIKIEFIPQPQQFEVEMLDADEVEEGSEMYSAAQQAKENAKSTVDGQQPQKAILAVVRPMSAIGSRREEKKQSMLEKNYGTRWEEPVEGNDRD